MGRNVSAGTVFHLSRPLHGMRETTLGANISEIGDGPGRLAVSQAASKSEHQSIFSPSRPRWRWFLKPHW
jgi:hypothetical protein